MNKKCTKCFNIKSIINYAKHIRYRDGHLTWCKSCVSENKKKWKLANKEHVRKTNRIYLQSEKRKIWRRKYRKTAIHAKLEDRLRNRMRDFLKGRGLKLRSSWISSVLGCNLKELKLHLESKFKKGMTWENYGLYGWHIDHIKPLSKSRDDIEKACHFSNLQPLWAEDNWKKHNKY